jgi:molybdopterin synthase catalytic subunit
MQFRRSAEAYDLYLTEEALSLDAVFDQLRMAEVGGIALFVGTVRCFAEGRTVEGLHYEAHASLALNELERIVQTALRRWPVRRLAVHHRLGDLRVGDVAVIVGAAAAHRAPAFEACRYVMDGLKQTVPIWKKEYFATGYRWVADPAEGSTAGSGEG